VSHDARHWDERYADPARPWLTEPSPAVTAAVADLPPGTALDLATGTGRHAIWLAGLGWQVTGVDFSAVGVEQGRARSSQVDWVVADLRQWTPAAPTDLVLVTYVQLGVSGLQRVAGWVAPGGRLVVVGHALRNLTDGVCGPRDPAYLHTEQGMRDGAADLVVERLEEVLRPDVGGVAIDLLMVARRD
jgi:SAM-dependent methyltransferase